MSQKLSWILLALCLFVASTSYIHLFLFEPLYQQYDKDGKCSPQSSPLLSPHSLLSQLNQRPREKDDSSSSSSSSISYDIVTVIHHHDMNILIDFGLESWQTYFASQNTTDTTRIFVICNPESYQRLSELRSNALNNSSNKTKKIQWESVFPVQESVFPFDLESVGKFMWRNKFGWIYQQLLKLYAHRVLLPLSIKQQQQQQQTASSTILSLPAIQRRYVIIDGDTVALRPHDFFVARGRGGNTAAKPVYNIATITSGAYQEDCWLSKNLFRTLFPKEEVQQQHQTNTSSMSNRSRRRRVMADEAFPNRNGEFFTAITHHQVMDGDIVNELLTAIEENNNGMEAWKVLSSIGAKGAILSEWELYMGYVMTVHRQDIVLRQIPYVNSGFPLTQEFLSRLTNERDVSYLTQHDEYRIDQQCCVNSEWLAYNNNKDKGSDRNQGVVKEQLPLCDCCSLIGCGKHTKITCMMLGIKGCLQDTEGYMWFEE